MEPLSLFGLFAVTLMLVFYALGRSQRVAYTRFCWCVRAGSLSTAFFKALGRLVSWRRFGPGSAIGRWRVHMATLLPEANWPSTIGIYYWHNSVAPRQPPSKRNTAQTGSITPIRQACSKAVKLTVDPLPPLGRAH